MPVVTERGLVGRIQKVGPTTATVLLITDPSSGVQSMIKRENSRAVGVVNGQAGGQPVMDYIAQEADVAVGRRGRSRRAWAATSRRASPSARSSRSRSATSTCTSRPSCGPTVDFNRLEFVLVITNFQPLPGQPPEMESVG